MKSFKAFLPIVIAMSSFVSCGKKECDSQMITDMQALGPQIASCALSKTPRAKYTELVDSWATKHKVEGLVCTHTPKHGKEETFNGSEFLAKLHETGRMIPETNPSPFAH